MVRIITRRSSHLQKRNRIQLYNLKQLIQSPSQSKSKSNKSSISKNYKSPKVLKSKKPQSIKPNQTKSNQIKPLPPTKITIITRSNKLKHIILDTITIKKESQAPEKVIAKIPIVTRSSKKLSNI